MNKKVLLFLFSLLLGFALVACDKKISQYTVTFESNGGSSVDSVLVDENSLVSEPTSPTKDGFDFKGWFVDESFNVQFKFTENKITEDIKLYAKWEEKVIPDIVKYEVKFNLNYQGSSMPSTILVNSGEKVSKPTNPSRDDYEFIGWTKDRSTQALFDFNTLITEDVTLYAVWESTEETVVVIFDPNNGDATFTKTVVVGSTIGDLEDPIKQGETFIGWFSNNKEWDLNEDLVVTEITLVAKYFVENESLGTPIFNAEGLLELLNNGGNKNYYLAADIDMSNVDYNGSRAEFSGVLDGNGKKISNLHVDTLTNNKSGALFGKVLEGGEIKNITFLRGSVKGPGEGVGFITYVAHGGVKFENITFVNVTLSQTASSYSGLIFADNDKNASELETIIKNIVVLNDENSGLNPNAFGAVLTGYLRVDMKLSFENIYIKSNIVAAGANAAGLVARANTAGSVVNVDQVVFEGNISAEKEVGIIFGKADKAFTLNVSNVFIKNSILSQTNSNATLIDLIAGNNKATLNVENVYYTNTVQILGQNNEELDITNSASLVEETEAWFNSSSLNKEFFKFDNGITHQVDLGDKVAETLTIAKNSYNPVFIKGVDLLLNLNDLIVNVSYSTGDTLLLEQGDYEVDDSAFNPDVAGEYDIVISFEGLEVIIVIEVVEIESLEVYTLDQNLVFAKNEVINENIFNNLVIHGLLADGSILLLESDLTYTLPNTDSNGLKEVIVTFKGEYTVSFNITVVDSLIEQADEVKVIVDQGAQSVGNLVDGIITVTNVTDAISLLSKSNLSSDSIKTIFVKNGVYYEKPVLKIPNVILLGESQEETIIEYDAANGTLTPKLGTWGTQGSATFTVSSAAYNFTASNITFKNSFDYNNSTISDKQAVALVTEADKAIFYKVSFLGMQDTLYAKNGRQWYLDVYIEGIVDYIFGNGGPAYFENSEIKTLERVGTSANAVITANKGHGSSSSELLEYSYVFYNNRLTKADGVLDNSVDLGRPWGKDANVAFINNTFNTHISQAGWTDMSGNEAVDANFVEFENLIGDITYESTLGRKLTTEEAALFSDKDVVFASSNGQVSFGSNWDYIAQLGRVDNDLLVSVTLEVDSEVLDVFYVLKGDKLQSDLPEPVKAGFTFEGWLLNGNDFDVDSIINENIILLADFNELQEGSSATITFILDDSTLDEFELELGTKLSAPVNPIKNNHIFLGWFVEDSQTPYNFNLPVSTSLELVAKFEEKIFDDYTAISTVEEFKTFLTKTSGNYYLINDIDFDGEELTTDEKKTFTGTLDGNGFAIKNLTRTTDRGGLFRAVKGATFINLTFDNVTMIGTNRAGMIAGEAPKDANISTFDNIRIINSSITGNANNGAGGLVGMGQAQINISNIVVIDTIITNAQDSAGSLIGQVDGKIDQDDLLATINISNIYVSKTSLTARNRAGGLFGESKNNALVNINNVVIVNTNIESTVNNAGGIAGKLSSSTINISDVFINADVKATDNVGHVIGENNISTVENTYFVNSNLTGIQNGTNVSGDYLVDSMPNNESWWDVLDTIQNNEFFRFDSNTNLYLPR